MRKRILIGLIGIVVIGIIIAIWQTKFVQRSPNPQDSDQSISGMSHEEQERRRELAEIEESLYPSEPTAKDWKEVRVSSGPGLAKGDYYPCSVLENFKPLLQMRQGVGVLGLQFSIRRGESGGLTTQIWSANAKKAISVDWNAQQVVPSKTSRNALGASVVPQYVPAGLGAFGMESGYFAIAVDKVSKRLPWKEGHAAYPLVLDRESMIGFCEVSKKEVNSTPTLDSVVYLSLRPPQLLGEIKMPASKTGLWCLYDKEVKALLVVEHEWHWIVAIDISKPMVNSQP